MDYQVSARKYRPGTFDDVIGQAHVVQTLVNSINTKRIAQAYLFSGTRGVGKTTIARILAKALNCERGPTGSPCATCANCLEIAHGTSVDVIEIDGASNTSVDDVREIRENVKFSPFKGKYRVYIIDEVHMLSTSAFNALLKTLEEPPPHVVFIFATTEIHKIPATILSRCQHYNFRRIAKGEVIDRLRQVAKQDGIKVEDRSLAALARASEGSMRDALSLLDQAVAFNGKSIVHEDLETLLGAVPQEILRAMILAITAQDSAAALRVLAQLIDQGHDLKAYCGDVVECLRNMLVISVTPTQEWPKLIEASAEDLAQLASDKGSLTPEQLQMIFALFTQAEDALRLSAHPRFVLETAAVKATRLLRRESETVAQPVRPTPSERAEQGLKPLPSRLDKTQAPERPTNSASPALPSRTTSTPSKPSSWSGPSLKSSGEATTQLGRTSIENTADTLEADRTVSRRSQKALDLNWGQFQDEVAHAYPNIAPFLEMGRLIGVDGNIATIGFAKQATVARGMLEKPDNIHALSSLCERLSGQPVRVRIVELTEADPPGPTMAQLRVAREKEEKLILFERAKADPVVKQALEIFGAELADVRTVSDQKEVSE